MATRRGPDRSGPGPLVRGKLRAEARYAHEAVRMTDREDTPDAPWIGEGEDNATEQTRLEAPADEPQPEAVVPVTPRAVEETGLEEPLLYDLALKHVYFGGVIEAIQVADRMALDFRIVSALLDELRRRELIMTQGGSAVLGGVRIRYEITERGRAKIHEVLERDNYCGPAPVPFAQYVDQLGRQSLRLQRITPARVRRAFDRLILDPLLPDSLGPAINSARSVFLYGPPGNGKTSLAQCIIDAVGGRVFIPHAIVLGTQIVRVFDELYHRELPADVDHDRRWVSSERPVVVVGGELTLGMLDLTWSGEASYSEAPFQVKANSGVLFIDDFGRQRCDPQDLLNRWIVPLESGFDFLTFRTGQKARVPFDTLVVFSTNLDPAELVDEAFLRRIRYKFEVADPTESAYRRIFEAVCRHHSVPVDEALLEHLLETHYRRPGRPLRCCHPRDLIEQWVDLCKYLGAAPALTPEHLDRICARYFVTP